MSALFRSFLIFTLLSLSSWATAAPLWYTQSADKKVTLRVELFLTSTCAHCQHADEFFQDLESNIPWLHVTRHVINKSKDALILFNQLLDGDSNFSVPSTFFCNSHWVGFATAQTTGKDLLKALHYCKEQIEKNGELTTNTVTVLKRWANANQYDTGIIDPPSAPYYILGMALIDAFNPCALFCFMAFLAMLFVQDSRKAQLATGLFFILGIGLVHYLQQVYAAYFFEYASWLRVPAAFLGLFILYLVTEQVKTRKSHHLMVLIAFLFAVMLQSYQQTCLMNWSYLFEQWVQNQQFTNLQIGLYELMYQVLYVMTLVITLIAYTLLIKMERFSRLKERLKTLGLYTMAVIAVILILYPYGLSYFSLSLGMLIALLIYALLRMRA